MVPASDLMEESTDITERSRLPLSITLLEPAIEPVPLIPRIPVLLIVVAPV
ncbi:MAG: hypothetical protein WDN50_20440 [Bradyrhizobium sp.]